MPDLCLCGHSEINHARREPHRYCLADTEGHVCLCAHWRPRA